MKLASEWQREEGGLQKYNILGKELRVGNRSSRFL